MVNFENFIEFSHIEEAILKSDYNCNFVQYFDSLSYLKEES